MTKAILRNLFLSCLLQYACAQMYYMYDYGDETTTRSLKHVCNQTVTERVRTIDISYNEIFNEFSYICAIYVENATFFHLMLYEKPTELNEAFYNASRLIYILIYDRDPSNGGLPVDELKGEEANPVTIVPGDRVWLSINLNIDDVSSVTTDFDDIQWSLAYVAVVNDVQPVCDVSEIEDTENGMYIVRNNTFGSVADLVCSEGYVRDNSSRLAICSIVDNALAWIPGTALCSSVCEHPPNVVHANMNPRMDTNIFQDNSRTGESTRYLIEETLGISHDGGQIDNTPRTRGSLRTDDTQRWSNMVINTDNDTPERTGISGTNSTPREADTLRNNDAPARTNTLGISDTPTGTDTLRNSDTRTDIDTLRTNVTVYYSCNAPYIIRGLDRIHCGPDPRGVPRWSDPPPSCIIPDCSGTIIFRQHSGAIVNPSYPATILKGGSLVCTWHVVAPEDTYILVYPMYVHLPDVPGVGVTVLDSGTSRPAPLLQLTNQTRQQNVTSETSQITVIYHGPSDSTSGYRGFYIRYVMQPREDRLRRAQNISAEFSPETYTSTPATKDADYTSNTSSGPLSTTHSELSSVASQATDNPPVPSVNQTREPITTQKEEQQVNFTSVQPTSTEEYASHAVEIPVNHTTQQTTNQPPEDSISSSWNTPTEVTNHPFSINTTRTVSVSPRNDTSAITDDVDDSGDVWKIAMGVIIPLCVLVLVLVCVFVYFRKKYPVRMIIGRDVAKFCNPQYARPGDAPALVREDASSFFSKSQSDISPEEPVPEKNVVVYENLGFSGDDSDEGKEQEDTFVETKNWLCRETIKVLETSPANMSEPSSESQVTGANPLPSKSWYEFQKAKRKSSKDASLSSTVADVKGGNNNESKITKVTMADSKTGISVSSQDLQRDDEQLNSDIAAPNDYENVSVNDDDSGRSSSSSCESESINIVSDITRDKREEEESGFMKTSMILFQQPTFEEVWARVKARSRSLSMDRPIVEVKQRSVSIDPCKSARKMSLHDDITTSEHFRLLASSARSDQQSETSGALNLCCETTPETSVSSSAEKNDSNDSTLELFREKTSKRPQPVNEDGSKVSTDDGHFGYISQDHNRNDDSCIEIGGVDESHDADNIVNDSNNERIKNLGTNTDSQISEGNGTTSETDCDVNRSKKLSRSDTDKMSSENPSSFCISHEEPTSGNSSSTQAEAEASRCSNEEQTKLNDSLQIIELSSLPKNEQDYEHSAGSHVHVASFLAEGDVSDSQTAAAGGSSNLYNIINPEQTIPGIEMTSQSGGTDGQGLVTSYSSPQNDDDINNNLNDSSDDESVGVKVTDSDISDILDNSNDENEPEDRDEQLADVHILTMNSNNTKASIILRQGSEDDTDV